MDGQALRLERGDYAPLMERVAVALDRAQGFLGCNWGVQLGCTCNGFSGENLPKSSRIALNLPDLTALAVKLPKLRPEFDQNSAYVWLALTYIWPTFHQNWQFVL